MMNSDLGTLQHHNSAFLPMKYGAAIGSKRFVELSSKCDVATAVYLNIDQILEEAAGEIECPEIPEDYTKYLVE